MVGQEIAIHVDTYLFTTNHMRVSKGCFQMQWEFTTSEDTMEVNQCLNLQGALLSFGVGDMVGNLDETQADITL